MGMRKSKFLATRHVRYTVRHSARCVF